MRISEVLRDRMEDYQDRYFRNVKRKGRRRDDVYLSPEARAALADYFDYERSRGLAWSCRAELGAPCS